MILIHHKVDRMVAALHGFRAKQVLEKVLDLDSNTILHYRDDEPHIHGEKLRVPSRRLWQDGSMPFPPITAGTGVLHR